MYETVAYGWIFAVNIPKIAGRYLAAISVAEVIMKLIQLSSRGFFWEYLVPLADLEPCFPEICVVKLQDGLTPCTFSVARVHILIFSPQS